MLDWDKIETVLLDMDGTLLDLHYDNRFWLHHLPARYAEIHGMDEDEARVDIMRRVEDLRGRLEWYCVDYWSEELDVDIVALKRELAHLIAERPDTAGFLKFLQQQGKDVHLITNAHRKALDLKLEFSDIGVYFDRMLCSHEIGVPKEQRIFWHKLQQQLPFDPAATLFIDDTVAVLDSARDYGIEHLLTLLRPDSGFPAREHGALGGYRALASFDELMPRG